MFEIKIIKKQSAKTYNDKKGNERHYYNYYIQLPNGQRVQIKASFPLKDNVKLDMVAEYER